MGKTLAQADSIARMLDAELDPIELMQEEALEVMLTEAERRLEPNQLLAYIYTQLDPLTRLPSLGSPVESPAPLFQEVFGACCSGGCSSIWWACSAS